MICCSGNLYHIVSSSIAPVLMPMLTIGAVDLLVHTHHCTSSCTDRFRERPHVKLVCSLVVHVCGDGLVERSRVEERRVPFGLLLVEDEVLDACNHTLLEPSDRLEGQDAGQVRIV